MTPAGDAVTVAQFQASGEIRTPLAAATRWPQGRCYQRDDFATFANFDLLAFFNPIEHGAEIVPDLPDGGGFHVSRRCDTWRRLSTPANEGNVELCRAMSSLLLGHGDRTSRATNSALCLACCQRLAGRAWS